MKLQSIQAIDAVIGDTVAELDGQGRMKSKTVITTKDDSTCLHHTHLNQACYDSGSMILILEGR